MAENISLVAQLIIDRTKALVAIQELHKGVEALMNPGCHERLVKVCTGCGTDDGNWQRWPCPTRRLADDALGDDQHE